MLHSYYTTLKKTEKQALIDQIVIICECRPTTAAAWCHEKRRPGPLEMKAIAELVGIKREILFSIPEPTTKFQKK